MLVSTCAGGDEDKGGDKGDKSGQDDKSGRCTHAFDIACCLAMPVI